MFFADTKIRKKNHICKFYSIDNIDKMRHFSPVL